MHLRRLNIPSFLRSWCPFDSVVVLWNPTWESIDKWAKVADPGFYADPANYSLNCPFSLIKGYSFLKKHDFPKPDNLKMEVRWDRYSSLDAMLDDQFQQFRFFNKNRPLGSKACLEVHNSEGVVASLRMDFYKWLFKLYLFVRINSWNGFHKWITSLFSVRRLYSLFRLSYQAKKLFRASTSKRSKS